MRIMVLGDLHLPWVNWKALEAAARDAEKDPPDAFVQVGDFIDAYSWSRFPKDPEAPNPAKEWDMVEASVARLHRLFDPNKRMYILNGNHCRRPMMRALEAQIPAQLIRPLHELFPFENWAWWVEQKPLVLDGINFIHGDESPGKPIVKAKTLGRCVVQGHTHRGSIDWEQLFRHRVFGMEVGTLMDVKSIAARYANRNLLRSWIGWARVEDGTPHLRPYPMVRR